MVKTVTIDNILKKEILFDLCVRLCVRACKRSCVGE